MAIDWPALRAAAVQMTERAHAPYSRLHVGAAGVTSDGRMVTGCNVETAFGAQGEPVGGGLHVAAGHHPAVTGHPCGLHMQPRIRRMSSFRHLRRGRPQRWPVNSHRTPPNGHDNSDTGRLRGMP